LRQKELLKLARKAFSNLVSDGDVEALVLRKYFDGQRDSLRIDDTTSVDAEVPPGFSHAVVVYEVPIDKLEMPRLQPDEFPARAPSRGLISE
jgi:hypothetical protein